MQKNDFLVHDDEKDPGDPISEEDRTSQSPPPNESTKGLPTGQTHWTARMSAPMDFLSSVASLSSHSRTGLVPCLRAEENDAQWTRSWLGHGDIVSKKILASICILPRPLPSARARGQRLARGAPPPAMDSRMKAADFDSFKTSVNVDSFRHLVSAAVSMKTIFGGDTVLRAKELETGGYVDGNG